MFSPETIELISKGGVIVLLIVMLIRAEMRADKEREKNEKLARESITQSVKIESTMETMVAILTGRKSGS